MTRQDSANPPKNTTSGIEQDRVVLRLSGSDVRDFLQNLVTNDVDQLDQGPVYAALLTPQGKLMTDFFLVRDGDAVLLDVAAAQAPALLQRLRMYKLRADVEIAETGLVLRRGLGPAPAGAVVDPRHPALGWRAYLDGGDMGDADSANETVDWQGLRVAHCLPEMGIELSNDSYILEAGFERLNGVDFRKGCYVGQEVTARMKHKTELRKGLVQVRVDGSAPIGTEITRDGKSVGVLYTQSGGRGIAYLRFDRAGPDMVAAGVPVRLID